MLGGDRSKFLGILVRLKAIVALTDGSFTEPLARLERADIFGDVVPLVHKLGVGTDQTDEFLAGHLWGLFLRLHGLERCVVFDGVIDGRGGEDGIEAALIRG